MYLTILTRLVKPLLPYLLAILLGAGGAWWWMDGRLENAKDKYDLLVTQYNNIQKLRKQELEELSQRNDRESARATERYQARLKRANDEIKQVRSQLENITNECPVGDDVHSLLDSASGLSTADSRISQTP